MPRLAACYVSKCYRNALWKLHPWRLAPRQTLPSWSSSKTSRLDSPCRLSLQASRHAYAWHGHCPTNHAWLLFPRPNQGKRYQRLPLYRYQAFLWQSGELCVLACYGQPPCPAFLCLLLAVCPLRSDQAAQIKCRRSPASYEGKA